MAGGTGGWVRERGQSLGAVIEDALRPELAAHLDPTSNRA
ncbi:hypothetical protein [Mycobacterium decipiens]